MSLELTEHQFMELRVYEDGHPHWRSGGRPSKNLIRRNLLTLAPATGKGFYRITEHGTAALVAFRERHGVAC